MSERSRFPMEGEERAHADSFQSHSHSYSYSYSQFHSQSLSPCQSSSPRSTRAIPEWASPPSTAPFHQRRTGFRSPLSELSPSHVNRRRAARAKGEEEEEERKQAPLTQQRRFLCFAPNSPPPSPTRDCVHHCDVGVDVDADSEWRLNLKQDSENVSPATRKTRIRVRAPLRRTSPPTPERPETPTRRGPRPALQDRVSQTSLDSGTSPESACVSEKDSAVPQAREPQNPNQNENQNPNTPFFGAHSSLRPVHRRHRHTPRDQWVFIIDWDNTLFPSDFLQRHGLGLDSHTRCIAPQVKAQLKALEQAIWSAIRPIIQLLGVNNVHIVTLAEKGWVERSALKFLPGIVPLLRPLHIVSARTRFERQFPGEPCVWKHRAMQQLLSASFQVPIPTLDVPAIRGAVRTYMHALMLRQHQAHASAALLAAPPRIQPNNQHQKPVPVPVPLSFHTQRQVERASLLASVAPVAPVEQFPGLPPRSQSAPADARHPVSASASASSGSVSANDQLFSLTGTRAQEEAEEEEALLHVVSIGDSLVERNAALVFGDILHGAVVKTVKFRERPSVRDVIHQLRALQHVHLSRLLAERRPLDIFL